MAKTRWFRVPIPAVAAGARSAVQQPATPDDNVRRHLTGIMVSNTTKLMHTIITVNGAPIADIEHGATNPASPVFPVDQWYEPGLPVQLVLVNDSAGALAVNTDAWMYRYELET